MNGQPKYLQIEHDLIRQIEMGILHPDDVVPTETELIASYGASRITVRHALDDLAAGGYIRRVQGKGTYVNRPNVKGLSINEYRMSYIAELRLQGYDAHRNVLQSETIVADATLADAEGLVSGESYFFFERLYDIDGVPFSYEKSFFLKRMVPGIEKRDLVNESINQILLEYGFDSLTISRATELRAISADVDIAKNMKTEVGHPLISLITRCEREHGGSRTRERIESSRAISRTDTLPLFVNG